MEFVVTGFVMFVYVYQTLWIALGFLILCGTVIENV